jgi:hypothetical protein
MGAQGAYQPKAPDFRPGQWDLPEDPEQPDEIKRLEETMCLGWKVRVQRNKKTLPYVPLSNFPKHARRQIMMHQASAAEQKAREADADASILRRTQTNVSEEATAVHGIIIYGEMVPVLDDGPGHPGAVKCP